MQAKIEAQLRCLGCGFVPEPMAREHIARRPAGRQGDAARAPRAPRRLRVALRAARRARRKPPLGLALQLVARAAREPGDAAARCSSATAAPLRDERAVAARIDRAPATSAASRRRRPVRCTPARWSPRWRRGSMRARTAGAGWCASRTSTRRAACPAPTQLILRAARRLRPACPTSRRCGSRRATRSTTRALQRLLRRGLGLSRAAARARDIDDALARARLAARSATASCVYPGTCRAGCTASRRARRALRTPCADGDDALRSTGTTAGSARSAGPGARGRRLRAAARRRAVGLPARGRGRRRRAGHHRTSCAARTWPTTRRARSICSGCSACRRRATCTRRWCSAPTARSCRSRTAPQPLDVARSARRAARGGHACSASRRATLRRLPSDCAGCTRSTRWHAALAWPRGAGWHDAGSPPRNDEGARP